MRDPPDHILTIINWLLDVNADRKWEKFTDSKQLKTPKTDCALNLDKDKEFYQLSWIPGLSTLKVQGSLPP